MRYTTIGRPENQRRDLIVAGVLVLVAWVLSSLGEEYKLGLSRSLRASVLAPFVAAHDVFAERSELASRADRLQRERDVLGQIALGSADLRAENERLRDLLALRERQPGTFVVAELVPGRPIVGDSHGFMLRAGRDSGLKPPFGVSVGDGLVGVVRSAGGRYGYGDFWTHPDFRVSVRSAGSDATGIVRALRTEEGESLMLLEGVPFQTAVPAGTLLVTSGLGGIYPPGIPVGTVLAEAESKSGWSRSFLVEPAVPPSAVSVVLAWQRPAGPGESPDDSG